MSRSVWNSSDWRQTPASQPDQRGVSVAFTLPEDFEFNTHYLYPGDHLLGNQYNGEATETWNVRASADNLPSYLVMRDTTGSFSAGHLTVSSLSLHTHTVITSEGNLVADQIQTQSGTPYLKAIEEIDQVQFGGNLTVQGSIQISGLEVLSEPETEPFANERLFVDGNMVVTGDIMALSDQRIKRDIAPVVRALDKVQELRGVTYKRVGDVSHAPCLGMIAQEVQTVFPEVVHATKDGVLGVSYGNLVAALIEAIKELTQEVRSLQRSN